LGGKSKKRFVQTLDGLTKKSSSETFLFGERQSSRPIIFAALAGDGKVSTDAQPVSVTMAM
jgi:hypothetical protein